MRTYKCTDAELSSVNNEFYAFRTEGQDFGIAQPAKIFQHTKFTEVTTFMKTFIFTGSLHFEFLNMRYVLYTKLTVPKYSHKLRSYKAMCLMKI